MKALNITLAIIAFVASSVVAAPQRNAGGNGNRNDEDDKSSYIKINIDGNTWDRYIEINISGGEYTNHTVINNGQENRDNKNEINIGDGERNGNDNNDNNGDNGTCGEVDLGLVKIGLDHIPNGNIMAELRRRKQDGNGQLTMDLRDDIVDELVDILEDSSVFESSQVIADKVREEVEVNTNQIDDQSLNYIICQVIDIAVEAAADVDDK